MDKIKLLDGAEIGKSEVLDNMMDDSYYYGYLGKASLSSSSCKKLLDSPKAYHKSINMKGKEKESAALRDGRVFHTMVLEPEAVQERYVLMDVGSRNSKAYKEALSCEDREIILTKEWNNMEYLVQDLMVCDEAKELLSDGEAEKPMIGEIFGVPFRAKADYLKSDMIVDLKTTIELGDIENPNRDKGWKWTAKNKWHYDMQAFIYTTLFDVPKFTFLIIEKGSGEVGIIEATDEFINSGRMKVKFAVDTYKKYFRDGRFDPSKYVKKAFI